MPVKKNSYIDFELTWLTAKAEELKAYIDDNPFHELEDRTIEVGNKVILAANVEKQMDSLIKGLKDYAQIIEIIDKLKEQEDQKEKKVRGDDDRSPLEKREF